MRCVRGSVEWVASSVMDDDARPADGEVLVVVDLCPTCNGDGLRRAECGALRPGGCVCLIECKHCHGIGDTSDGRPCWKCDGSGIAGYGHLVSGFVQATTYPIVASREAAYCDPRDGGHVKVLYPSQTAWRIVDHARQSDMWLMPLAGQPGVMPGRVAVHLTPIPVIGPLTVRPSLPAVVKWPTDRTWTLNVQGEHKVEVYPVPAIGVPVSVEWGSDGFGTVTS